MTGRRGQAAGLALALIAFALVLLAATLGAGHAQTVAGVAWTVPGLGARVPWSVFSVWLPCMLVLGVLLGGATAGRDASGRVPRVHVAASLLVLASLMVVWALHLVAHHRLLSAWHAALVLVAWLQLLRASRFGRRAAWRWLALAGAAVTLATLTYGAIWGEARCRQPGELGCLRDSGVRVRVPALWASVGVPVFADLRGVDLGGVVLRGRDLRLADLRGATLTGADLRGANLRRARLDGIAAEGSVWRGAMLDGASLRQAGLARTDLGGVHAYAVDLSGADLTDADARGASFSHARLDDTRLAGTRLAGAYLRFTTGWTQQQLQAAVVDPATRLPDGMAGRP